MENATKGLMIAGAILIAIVLIGIGVFLVSQAQGFMDQGGQQFDEMTRTSFNSPFESYSGVRSGSEIRALISRVNSSNLTAAREGTYAEQGIKLIFVSDGGTQYTVDGTVADYQSATANRASNAANTGKRYFVSLGYKNSTGLIRVIAITAVGSDQASAESTANGLVDSNLDN